MLADIYGVRNAGRDWYLKLYVVQRDVIVASCHPPERPLRRVDGIVVGRPRKR